MPDNSVTEEKFPSKLFGARIKRFSKSSLPMNSPIQITHCP